MINENLGKLVQAARDKKPTNFKTVLTAELDSRIAEKVTEIKDNLSKNMFKENCEGHPDGVEHTHEDGTVHTHEGGDAPHTHEDEESIHEENPYVRKLSKPAQKVFHQVMHIINMFRCLWIMCGSFNIQPIKVSKIIFNVHSSKF